MARRIIILGAIIPAVCLAINIIWPPGGYAYLAEMTLLLLFALAALWLSRESIRAALFLYCASVQIPVLAMVEHYQRVESGWSVFILVPFVGLLIIGLWVRDNKSIISFAIIALVASVAVGVIYDDIGQAGALAILTLITARGFVGRCNALQDALIRIGIIERGLDGVLREDR